MNEIWKDIPGYDGLYKISNLGNIQSIQFNHSNMTKPLKFYDKSGYNRVTLYNKNGHRKVLIHRIVATVFIPNPSNKPIVNHKDGNKLNNCVDNLEWVTHKENVNHAINNNLRPKINCKCPRYTGKENPQSKPLLQLTMDGKVVKEWENSVIASKELNYSFASIRRCARGERNTYKGYKWAYK